LVKDAQTDRWTDYVASDVTTAVSL